MTRGRSREGGESEMERKQKRESERNVFFKGGKRTTVCEKQTRGRARPRQRPSEAGRGERLSGARGWITSGLVGMRPLH